MVVWGIIATATLFVHTTWQFYGMRFLLGIAEAGFYPASFSVDLLVSGAVAFPDLRDFLPRHCAVRSYWRPLSGWIMNTFSGLYGLHGWQWLFPLEGTPAIIFGVMSYFYLDDGPAKAKWLAPSEKLLAVGELEEENQRKLTEGVGHKFSHAMKDVNVWLLAFANFALLSVVYGVSFWMPQIIRDLGVQDFLTNGLITSVPYAVACVGMILIGNHSDHTGERKWRTAACGVLGAIGLVLSGVFAQQPVISRLGLSLAMTGALAGLAVMWALPGTILTGAAAAAGIALMATVGNLGGYIAPITLGLVKQDTGHLE